MNAGSRVPAVDSRHARSADDVELPGLLLAAEHAVDIGARTLRQGRSHIGALIGKGDRDFATDIDLRIESEIKGALAQATPEIPFLGEEGDGAVHEAIVGIADFKVGVRSEQSRYTLGSVASLADQVRAIVAEAQ